MREWYSGEFKENKRHGFGTYKYGCGNKYTGNWVNDMKEGEGKMTYPDNSSFKGRFWKDKKNGTGVAVSSNGSETFGVWQDDLLVTRMSEGEFEEWKERSK